MRDTVQIIASALGDFTESRLGNLETTFLRRVSLRALMPFASEPTTAEIEAELDRAKAFIYGYDMSTIPDNIMGWADFYGHPSDNPTVTTFLNYEVALQHAKPTAAGWALYDVPRFEPPHGVQWWAIAQRNVYMFNASHDYQFVSFAATIQDPFTIYPVTSPLLPAFNGSDFITSETHHAERGDIVEVPFPASSYGYPYVFGPGSDGKITTMSLTTISIL